MFFTTLLTTTFTPPPPPPELSIDGDLWLQSASGVETFFDNAWHSNVDGSLKLVNSSNTTDTPYEDQIGYGKKKKKIKKKFTRVIPLLPGGGSPANRSAAAYLISTFGHPPL